MAERVCDADQRDGTAHGPVASAEEASEGPCIIVVPTLNEAVNIPVLIPRITEAAPDAHILIVDDQSTDGTAEAAVRAFGGDSRHRVMVRTGPKGLGRAYVEAFSQALRDGYETVVQMDADLSHDPATLPALRNALSDADLAIGSRYCPGGGVEGWAAHRLWLSRLGNAYARAVTGMRVTDVTAGFRAWRSSALTQIHIERVRSSGYSFQIEMAVRAHCAGLRIREVPIIFRERRRGKSKMSMAILLEAVGMPWRLRAYIRRMQREGTWRQSS